MPASSRATAPSDTTILSAGDTGVLCTGRTTPRRICKIADCIDEWERAFRLVYDCYVAKGLLQPNRHRCRVMRHHLLAAANTFIAKQDEQVLCCVTLVGDSEEGLPLEQLYPEEIRNKRAEGKVLAEVSCLASRLKRRDFLPVFLDLMQMMCQHARRFGIDRLLIATHPRHAKFYQKFMGYQQFGEIKSYPSLHDAPAVACCLDFDDVDRRRPVFYDQVFGEELPLMDLLPQPMTPAAIARFEPMLKASAECLPMFA